MSYTFLLILRLLIFLFFWKAVFYTVRESRFPVLYFVLLVLSTVGYFTMRMFV